MKKHVIICFRSLEVTSSSDLTSNNQHFYEPLHGLKLINALFGVALADLAEGLVFVAARLHVLGVDQVIGGLLALVYCRSKLAAQELKENAAAE